MHVVHTIGALGDHHGGPPRSITALCSALAENGTDVDLFSLEDPEPDCRLILPKSARVRVHVLAGHQSNLRSARMFGSEVANAVRPGESVIHANGIWLPVDHAVARAATRARVARVISPRGMLTPWALGFRRWKKRLGWLLYQRRDLESASLIHVTSEEEAAGVRENGLSQPIAVVPNGVEVPPPSTAAKSSGPRQALYLGRLHRQKGIFELIEAWKHVRPVDWQLTIAGPDDRGHQPEVEAAIERNGLSNSVTLLGAVSDDAKWSLYAQSDLFILPSFSENFGIAIAEALASGLPVITTKGAPWSVIASHNCGWWIDIGTEPLEAALREATCLSDTQLKKAGQRGRDLIIRSFSWERIASDMQAVYSWVLKGGAHPSSIRLV